jgi:hypothetical protein
MDDDDEPNFTPEEGKQLVELYRRRKTTMDEIVALLALELGYGDIATLTPEQREAVADEADEAEERWMGEAEMGIPPPLPKTPLQTLLRDHHHLGKQILDIQNDEERRRIGRDEDEDFDEDE